MSTGSVFLLRPGSSDTDWPDTRLIRPSQARFKPKRTRTASTPSETSIAPRGPTDFVGAHKCGWADIRQKDGGWPPAEHFSEIVDGILDPDASFQTRFLRLVTAGIGFAFGFALGLLGLRRRWSAAQAAWGFVSSLERTSKWLAANPEMASLMTALVWVFVEAEGVGQIAGGAVPVILSSVLGLRRVTKRVKAWLRPRVEAGWIMDEGFAFGGFARRLRPKLIST
jgi:hypothetical protein